jgi:hypothetical protein
MDEVALMARKTQGRDQRIFEERVGFLENKSILPKGPGELIVEIGKLFLGTPYVASPLETKGAEHLVVDLKGYDCFAFVESAVALAWLSKSRKKSFAGFRSLLRKIRYRQGRVQGYASRLHYFSDWIHDNQKKGILRNVTAEMGGKPLRKAVTFMTAHRDRYPSLKDEVNLRRMKSVERTISKRSRFFIPKKILRRLEDRIREGDLIAITTKTEGLDVQHVGLAARPRNRIHLLHASSLEGMVVLSKNTLYRYLMRSKVRSGIMVARVNLPVA